MTKLRYAQNTMTQFVKVSKKDNFVEISGCRIGMGRLME